MKGRILFALGGILNLYLIPIYCWHTWEGDKGDTAMGLVFGLIPIGWALLTFLWGLLRKEREFLFPFLVITLLALPLLLIPKEGGGFLVYTLAGGFLTAALGQGAGILIRLGSGFLLKKQKIGRQHCRKDL